MQTGIAEIVGVFLVIAGCAGFVGAASLVSVALAVTVAATFILLGGVILLYIAATLDRAGKAAAKAAATNAVRG